MRMQKRFLIVVVLVLAVAQLVFATALDDYVAAPDASYKYSVEKVIEAAGYKAYVIDMTSQTWRSKDEVDRPVWQHWLTVVKPDKATGDTALLYINGGSNGKPAPTSADMMLGMIAMKTNTVGAGLERGGREQW